MLRHLVVAVPCIVIHVIPEVHGDAFVTLTHVMIPQTRQVKQIAGVDTDLLHGRLCVLRILFQIRFQRINAHPFDGDRFSSIFNWEIKQSIIKIMIIYKRQTIICYAYHQAVGRFRVFHCQRSFCMCPSDIYRVEHCANQLVELKWNLCVRK